MYEYVDFNQEHNMAANNMFKLYKDSMKCNINNTIIVDGENFFHFVVKQGFL